MALVPSFISASGSKAPHQQQVSVNFRHGNRAYRPGQKMKHLAWQRRRRLTHYLLELLSPTAILQRVGYATELLHLCCCGLGGRKCAPPPCCFHAPRMLCWDIGPPSSRLLLQFYFWFLFFLFRPINPKSENALDNKRKEKGDGLIHSE